MKLLNFAKGIALLFAILLSFNFIEGKVFDRLDQTSQEAANEKNVSYMPVIVLSSDKIDLIPFDQVKEYQRQQPNSSFLIPQDREEILRQELRELAIQRHVDAFWTFKVEQRAEGKQLLHVSCLGDGATESWYEATDKTIQFKFVKRYGPGFVFIVLQYACPLTALLWLPFIAGYLWYTRRKRENS